MCVTCPFLSQKISMKYLGTIVLKQISCLFYVDESTHLRNEN